MGRNASRDKKKRNLPSSSDPICFAFIEGSKEGFAFQLKEKKERIFVHAFLCFTGQNLTQFVKAPLAL